MELKEVMDALDKRDSEIKGFLAKAEEEVKSHGQILDETKQALTALTEQGSKMQAQILDLEKRTKQDFGARGEPQKSAAEMLTASDEFRAMQKRGRGIANIKVAQLRTKAATDIGGSAGIAHDRVPGIVAPVQRQLHVRDLLMPGTTGSNAIDYTQETGFTNSAASVAEFATKPQSDLTLTDKTANVKTLAHWFRASKQVLADIPTLQSYINGRAIYDLKFVEDAQLLSGDGTSENLQGLTTVATAYSGAQTGTGVTQLDVLALAIKQSVTAEYAPSGIVLNAGDWWTLRGLKDTQGRYIFGDPAGQQLQGQIWGIPVVPTNSMAAGEFMVGAFDRAAQVFDREDAAVEVSTEDGDNFVTNRVTIRAEERLALAVYRPQAFVYGKFTA